MSGRASGPSENGNGGLRKLLIGALVGAAGWFAVWDRNSIRSELEAVRTQLAVFEDDRIEEDRELRALIRRHASGEGLVHDGLLERFRALERVVFGGGK